MTSFRPKVVTFGIRNPLLLLLLIPLILAALVVVGVILVGSAFIPKKQSRLRGQNPLDPTIDASRSNKAASEQPVIEAEFRSID